MSREDAERDSIIRIGQYEAVYETITTPNLSYLQIISVGRQVVVRKSTDICRVELRST
jgi:6-phosphofructo-2-kinase/fructose-2,6-biphosphatase 2